MTANENVVTIPKKAGSGHKAPIPTNDVRPAAVARTFLIVSE